MHVLSREIQTALRGFRRRPAFTAGVVATLAVTLGANIAIFSLVDAVVLRRLPFAGPERLVMVHAREAGADQVFSIADFLDLEAVTTRFQALVAWSSTSLNLTGVDEPIRLTAQWTTPGFFQALGVRPALGRLPSASEERGTGARVALLGDSLWRSRFGGDVGILGRSLILGGEAVVVIGVLQPEFVFLSPGAELVLPLPVETDPRRPNRGAGFLRVLGRLAPDATLESATAELGGVVAALRAAYPDTNGGDEGVRLEPLAERVAGGFRRTLFTLQVAVAAVLALACLNLAILFRARAVGRRDELALRLALGARRRDLVRQLVTEALTLSALGGALGMVVAAILLRLFLVFGPERLPRAGEIGMDARALVVAVLVSLVVGLAYGLLPAIQGSGEALLTGEPRDGSRGGGRRRRHHRAALLVVEAMLALVLLAVGGLMLRSFHRLQAVDPGFQSDRVLALELSLPNTVYDDPGSISRYGALLAERLRALPGVETAGVTSVAPLTAWRAWVHFTIEGREDGPLAGPPIANYRAVGPGYFATLGIPLRAGRDVEPDDGAEDLPVALVSETLVARHFAGSDPLGARLTIDDVGGGWRTVEVVGVVGDVHHAGLDTETTADIFVPYAQTPSEVSVWLANLLCVVVRTDGDPLLLAPAVRGRIRELDGDVTVKLSSMQHTIAASLAGRRFDSAVLAAFGFASLLLALAGIYAVTAIGVTERRAEIALRVSLGASQRRILDLIVGGTLAPVTLGLVLGLAILAFVGRLIETLLFDIAPHDPLTLVLATSGLGAAALTASLVPALRALRVDPVSALRGG